MQGVEAVGADLHIISAQHGLMAAAEPLLPYERTFQGMSRRRVEAEAARLQVGRRLRGVLGEPYDLFVIAVSRSYLWACDLPKRGFGGKAVVFTSEPKSVPQAFVTFRVSNDRLTLRLLGCNKISAGARAAQLFLEKLARDGACTATRAEELA
jgi:hypothetical protein